MSSHRLRSTFIITALTASLALQVLGTAHAVSIHGAVVNGTTGATDVNATVAVISPSSGMAPIHTVQATNGKFSIDRLDPGTYIARVEYGGVSYNWPFQIVGDEHTNVTVTVYETTSSWEGVKVVVPHFTAARHGDHLVIERVYDIHNEPQPPRTITGDDGFFRFPLPNEMHSFNGLYVQYGEVPIERQPVETDEEGVFKLDYPIRPGLTRVVMTYTAEYDTGAVAINEKLLYDIEGFTIFATDAEMAIASSSHDLAQGEGPHAGVSWDINGLTGGDVLNLSFRGGADQEQTAASGGSQHMVIVVPNEAENLSLVLMVILLLALIAFIGISMREPRVDGSEALRLSQHRNLLIQRLAKLDDLNETGAIPSAAYHAKRAELKNQVASLTFRLGESESAGTQTESGERSHG
jgi:hypothetical protein